MPKWFRSIDVLITQQTTKYYEVNRMYLLKKFSPLAVAFATVGIAAVPSQSLAQTASDCSGDYDKVFVLEATNGPWTILDHHDNTEDGVPVVFDAMMYNGTVPGPTLDVTEGDRVCVQLTNSLTPGTSDHALGSDTALHHHGLNSPFISNYNDGVPSVGAGEVIPTGTTVAYEWVAPAPGTYTYHSHAEPDDQVMLGLHGAIVVSSSNTAPSKYAQEKVWFLSEWRANEDAGGLPIQDSIAAMPFDNLLPNYFTINGKAFDPVDISPDHIITLSAGQTAKISLIGIGSVMHTMHMHGRNFRVIARDSVPIWRWSQQEQNTIVIHPGEIVDIEFTAGSDINDQGLWVFHCHVLIHATNNHHYPGGMVSAINVVP